jgi:RNA polymerase sigma-70 factor (sigma-E family)
VGRGRIRSSRKSTDRSGEFDEFVSQCVRSLTRAAVFITWDLADAEDVVQDALHRTAMRWDRVKGMAYPYAYARRVVVHQALRGAEERANQRRELRGWPEGFIAEPPAEGGDSFATVEQRIDLARILGVLPPRQRAVVLLRFAEQLTESEVAELLGWPLGTVKSTTARALERLRSEHRTYVDSRVTRATNDCHISSTSAESNCPSRSTARSES